MLTTHRSHRVLPRKQVEKRRPHSAFDHCRHSGNLCRTLAGRSQAGRGSASSARNSANHVPVMRKWCRVAHGERKVCRAACRKRETCGGVSACPLRTMKRALFYGTKPRNEKPRSSSKRAKGVRAMRSISHALLAEVVSVHSAAFACEGFGRKKKTQMRFPACTPETVF